MTRGPRNRYVTNLTVIGCAARKFLTFLTKVSQYVFRVLLFLTSQGKNFRKYLKKFFSFELPEIFSQISEKLFFQNL
jgi:hypothetical protein